MKWFLPFIGLLIMVFVFALSDLISNDHVKNNHGSSRSIAESIQEEVFKGYLILEGSEECKLDAFKYTFWYEEGWQPRYFLSFKIGIRRLNFFNIYFKPKSTEDIEISILNLKSSKTRRGPYMIEPPLGFRFRVSKTEDLNNLNLVLRFNEKTCKCAIVQSSKKESG